MTKLTRPTGTIPALWIGQIGDTGLVHIRWWEVDPKTGRNSPIVRPARYCQKHCILFLDAEYSNGCPECQKELQPTQPGLMT
jgi:hypothetical protein